jgi:hypothetical protein
MRATTPLAVGIILSLAMAARAPACDVGPFPDTFHGAVVAIGRVDKVTETPGPTRTYRNKAGVEMSIPSDGKASVEISIEKVPVGAFPGKSHHLEYTTAAPGSFCVYSEGPPLHEGDRVALYFSDQLRLMDWFLAEEAVRSDPRLQKQAHPGPDPFPPISTGKW